MHHLLKQAQLFLAQAQNTTTGPNIEAAKAQKKQEIQKHIDDREFKILVKDIENYYSFIKEDPSLLENVANFIVHHDKILKTIKYDKKELSNAVFRIMLDNNYSYYQIFDAIRLWGPVLDRKLIRRYEQLLISVIAKYIKMKEEDQKEENKHIYDNEIATFSQKIGIMLRDPKIAPYIDAAPLERIISRINPKELPAFKNDKRQLKTTDILKLFLSRFKGTALTMEKLKKIYSKSSPQAQQLLRSVLWEGTATDHPASNSNGKKFMLDESGSAMDVNMKPVPIYGQVIPVEHTHWNKYDIDDYDKWLDIFKDFKIVPFIEF